MPLINCKTIADDIMSGLDNQGATLFVIQCTEDEAAASYIRQLRKAAEKVNIRVDLVKVGYGTPTISETIDLFNDDKLVSGIMLVSPGHHLYKFIQHIKEGKRVEGNDTDDQIHRVSCTARACTKIIQSVTPITGKKCLVVGYGKAVGKPLSYLLMREHAALVTSAHGYTPEDVLYDQIEASNVIISAVGKAHFIKPKRDFKDKIFIDAGISVTGGQIAGDIHPDLQEHNHVTPVPGGVGPVTTALLLRNVWLAHQGLF